MEIANLVINSVTALATVIATVVAVFAACFAWKEYRSSQRPKLFVYLFEEFERIQNADESVGLLEWSGLRLENVGSRPALNVSLVIDPGIPWPLGARPAGEQQSKLLKRRISYLYPKNTTNLIFADRGEFYRIVFDMNCQKQHIGLDYTDYEGNSFHEEFDLDLRDMQYIEAVKKPL